MLRGRNVKRSSDVEERKTVLVLADVVETVWSIAAELAEESREQESCRGKLGKGQEIGEGKEHGHLFLR